mmetsp:Transcript_81849/g.162517  ORF Transcript_81849/g.162517 Transcript_81849/m.162517 type:complete len:172 (+) Transcript_81849:52-567(+)|eukprot:CAMPEP_0172721104 /NCGR_PEP_ID=MMETSP1074-20121228/78343_1 /TAXON_ID=2916 /ORGANISM="Ceratium fusus, Strain PA161109" /LENGTH=171 /DNA_ID=CAMNT_0013546763 /DNA_START=49 /DNA_END=564 /DNA_ORIENTATION=+
MASGSSMGDFFPDVGADATDVGAASTPAAAPTPAVHGNEFLFGDHGDPAVGSSAIRTSGVVSTAFVAAPDLRQVPFASASGHNSAVATSHAWHITAALHTVRTGVMVAGSMCSKLFGLGMVGFLAFQSIKANMATEDEPPEPPPRKQPELIKLSSARRSCDSEEADEDEEA